MLASLQHKQIFSKIILFYMKKTSNEGREGSAHYPSPIKILLQDVISFLFAWWILPFVLCLKPFLVASGVVVITTAQLHSTNLEFSFCASSNSACDVSEIRDYENLWQWSRLEIRLNSLRLSTIPQKQFIININIIIIIIIIEDELKE